MPTWNITFCPRTSSLFPVGHQNPLSGKQLLVICIQTSLNEGCSDKNSPANAGDLREASSTPGSSPGGGHGNPLQRSCLENSADRGAWQATVQRVTKSRNRLKQLSVSLNEHVYLFQRNDIWGLIIEGRCCVRGIFRDSEHMAVALSVAREGYDCSQQVWLVHWCQCIEE